MTRERYRQCHRLTRYYRARVFASIDNIRAYRGDEWREGVYRVWLRSHLAAYRYWRHALRTEVSA